MTVTHLRSNMEEQQVSANQAVPNVDEKESKPIQIEIAINKLFEDQVNVIKQAKILFKRNEKAMEEYNRWLSKLSELINTKWNDKIKICTNCQQLCTNINCEYAWSGKEFLENRKELKESYEHTLLSIPTQNIQ